VYFRQAKQDATELQEQSKQLKESIKQLEEKEKQIVEARSAALVPIGNIVHDSVPVSDNEVRNKELGGFGYFYNRNSGCSCRSI